MTDQPPAPWCCQPPHFTSNCPLCPEYGTSMITLCAGHPADEDDNRTVVETAALHARRAHPDYEYATTEGPRKAWDDIDRPPYGDNGEPDHTWERNVDAGRPGAGWDRFDYTEESYWRRRKPAAAVVESAATAFQTPVPTATDLRDRLAAAIGAALDASPYRLPADGRPALVDAAHAVAAAAIDTEKRSALELLGRIGNTRALVWRLPKEWQAPLLGALRGDNPTGDGPLPPASELFPEPADVTQLRQRAEKAEAVLANLEAFIAAGEAHLTKGITWGALRDWLALPVGTLAAIDPEEPRP